MKIGKACIPSRRCELFQPSLAKRSFEQASFLLSARGRQNIGPVPGVCCRATRKPYHTSIARCTSLRGGRRARGVCLPSKTDDSCHAAYLKTGQRSSKARSDRIERSQVSSQAAPDGDGGPQQTSSDCELAAARGGSSLYLPGGGLPRHAAMELPGHDNRDKKE